LIGLCGFVRETRVRTAHRGEIVQMYVHPGYQGLGIGTRLLRQTIDQALSLPGIEQIVLSLVADNEAALQLYRRLGFVEYGRLKQYFKLRDGYLDQRFMVLAKEKHLVRTPN
jgi:ribosomal protein S18 acetylase RimI-like enzyme